MLEKKKRAAASKLSVSIPSLFRCPISLDVMKSPVSLSTGITYDRSSILKWLDAGHNTCPATMQVLNSKDLVPNHTLHRLIQIWSDSVNDDVEVDQSVVPCSKQQAREMVDEMRVGDSDLSVAVSLQKLACFGGESDVNRKFLVGIDGFLDLVVDLICNAVDGDLAEQAVRIIPAIVTTEESEARRLGELMLNRDSCVSNSFIGFLRSSSLEAKIAAAKVIEIVASDAESKLVFAEKDGLIDQLMTNFVEIGSDQSLMESVLSCLISLSMVKRVKVKLVRLGIVASISKLLTNSVSILSIERMLKLLETVSSCKEGRTEICNDSTCIAAVLNKTMKVSKVATEHAVTMLWIVCYLFRGEKAIEAVARNNGLTKVLLVMQSNCSAGVRQMAGDVLKMLRLNSKSCLWSYDNKMTHITSVFD